MYTSPRASSDSTHSSYREIKVAEFSPDTKEQRKRKARLIVVGTVSVVALVIALGVVGGVYAWGRKGNADVGY
jgi:uncharacterized protein HemX